MPDHLSISVNWQDQSIALRWFSGSQSHDNALRHSKLMAENFPSNLNAVLHSDDSPLNFHPHPQ